MENLICAKCNFKFKARKLEACPYCGDLSSVEKEKSAEDLLEEIERLQ